MGRRDAKHHFFCFLFAVLIFSTPSYCFLTKIVFRTSQDLNIPVPKYEEKALFKQFARTRGLRWRFQQLMGTLTTEIPAGTNSTASFLRKMGVKNAKVLRHARRKGLKEAAELSPLLAYLEEDLGLVNLASLLDQCPQLVTRDPEKDLRSTVDLLEELYGRESARHAIQMNPFLLCVKVKQQMSTSASVYLESLGIPTEGIQETFPHLLSLNVNETIFPVWDYMVETIGSAENTRTAIRKFPNLLGLSVEVKLKPTVHYLQEIGMHKLDKVLVRYPQLLGMSLEDNIKPKVSYLQRLGLNIQGGFLNRHPAILMMSLESNLKPKVKYFRDIGILNIPRLFKHPTIFSLKMETLRAKVEFLESIDMNVRKEVESCPFLLGLSLEDNLIPKTKFLHSVGYSSSEFLGRYLLASLEQRIGPRSYYIQEHGGSFPSLNVLTVFTDEQFCKAMKYSLTDFLEFSKEVSEGLQRAKMLRLWIEKNIPMS